MHAWESIQKTLNYIEEHIGEEIQIEELADLAGLSLFYYQRLFARLVKKPVREYVKLRRLARACESLRNKENSILNVAVEYGFGGRETFTRAFKDTYGITPAQYRDKPVGLMNYGKPDLSLNYRMVDEGVPLIGEGLVLEYNRRTLREPVNFLGVVGYYSFTKGKMMGERTGVDESDAIWKKFFDALKDIPHIPGGRILGVSYHGDAPDGYSTYFIGVEPCEEDSRFVSWQLPAREYVICSFEADNPKQLMASMGKMMKFTRGWLKSHGLIADGFFPEMYDHHTPEMAYMEMWIPFRARNGSE